MEYKNEKIGVRFVVPDKLTVREQMQYYSALTIPYGKELFIRYWEGAKVIITEWECEVFPNKETSLDDVTDGSIPNILIWSGMRVKEHIDSLTEIPKK